MSLLDNDRYEWRDTYFVWFNHKNRPLLKDVERAIARTPGHLTPTHGMADESGRLEGLTILSQEDHAAMEIRFVSGASVTAEAQELAKGVKPSDLPDARRLTDLKRANARFDVSHFEDVCVEDDEEGVGDDFDPSALMSVLETLVGMTDGVAVDPQSGLLI